MKPRYQVPVIIPFSNQRWVIAEGSCGTGSHITNNCNEGCFVYWCLGGTYPEEQYKFCCPGGTPGPTFFPPSGIDCGVGEMAETGSCLSGPIALTTCTTGDCPSSGCISGSTPCGNS
jgi:hypothetical protein